MQLKTENDLRIFVSAVPAAKPPGNARGGCCLVLSHILFASFFCSQVQRDAQAIKKVGDIAFIFAEHGILYKNRQRGGRKDVIERSETQHLGKKTAAFLEKYDPLLKIEKCEESTRINHPAAGERKVIRMICPPRFQFHRHLMKFLPDFCLETRLISLADMLCYKVQRRYQRPSPESHCP